MGWPGFNDVSKTATNFLTPENRKFYASRPYKSLDPERKEFRILEVLPGFGKKLIRCRLIQCSEAKHQPYECISYQAGSVKETKKIEVDGKTFNAFATLAAALYNLRLPDKSRYLWADQISINQSDVSERGHQVRQMKSIYANADVVNAWLGELEDSELALRELSFIRSTYHDAKLAIERQTELGRFKNYGASGMAAFILRQGLLTDYRNKSQDRLASTRALGRVLRCDIWSRIWIMQELIMSKNIRLCWKNCTLDWKDITESLPVLTSLAAMMYGMDLQTASCISHLVGVPYGLKRHRIQNMETIRLRRDQLKRGAESNLQLLIQLSRSCESTDLRDRVYAICGLMPPRYTIVPDYTISLRSVYCKTVETLIAVDKSLDCLIHVHHAVNNDYWNKNLPSWCLDWSRQMSYGNRRRSLVPTFSSTNFKAASGRPAQWSCDAGPVDGHLEYRSLFLSGCAVDTITYAGSADDILSKEQIHDDPTAQFTTLLQSWANADAVRWHKKPNLGFASHDKLMAELHRTGTLDNRGQPDFSVKDTGTDAEIYRLMLMDALTGRRRFVVTGAGFVGMAPPHVEVGDVACVLFGGSVPFVLRREDEARGYCTFVGELYLNGGIMYGKAMDMLDNGELEAETFELR